MKHEVEVTVDTHTHKYTYEYGLKLYLALKEVYDTVQPATQDPRFKYYENEKNNFLSK